MLREPTPVPPQRPSSGRTVQVRRSRPASAIRPATAATLRPRDLKAGAAPAERGDCPFGFDLERAGADDDERVDERRDALKRYLDAFANTLVSETDQESFSHLMEQVLH